MAEVQKIEFIESLKRLKLFFNNMDTHLYFISLNNFMKLNINY